MTARSRRTGLDEVVELLARWLAARTTRRSFLARMAKVAVFVATGPSLAVLLARRAEARVCGQSGITPKCPTFDCNGADDVWGWCWYASPGCCANGGLKKICDCCTVNWPNVHGYCPAGTNVRCIMESCYADPRVLAVGLTPLGGADHVELAVAALGATVPVVFVGGELAPVTGPLAAARRLPMLLSDGQRLDPRVIRALQRRRTTSAVVVTGDLSAPVIVELRRYVTVEAVDVGIDAANDEATWMARVAGEVLRLTGERRIIAVDAVGVSGAMRHAASALASAAGLALVIGPSAVAAAHADLRPVVTWLVGPGWPAGSLGAYAGAKIVGDTGDLAASLREATARIAENEALSGARIVLVPVAGLGDDRQRVLPALPSLVGFHPPGTIDEPTQAWLRRLQPRVAGAVHLAGPGGLNSDGIWQSQSALNHFDTHQLIGVSGQGLPVISQPRPERPVGGARVYSYAPGEAPQEPPYWLARADPNRSGG